MSTIVAEKKQQFQEIIAKIDAYREALSIMYWDLRTGAPRKGAEMRSQSIGVLSTDVFKLRVSDEMGACLDVLNAHEEELDAPLRKMVKDMTKDYNQSKLIPPDLYQEYIVLTSNAETIWEEAKAKQDYEMFKPYLRDVVRITQQFINYWGVKDTRYDTLLDMYEPGLTVAELDKTFSKLKDQLVPLVKQVQEADHVPESGFLKQTFSIEKQKQFSHYILKEMGFDFDAGRLDESVHPFQTTINQRDTRITTHYMEQDAASAVFSALHEGGHALYEQNINKEFAQTPLSQGTSMGIHESQSRLWENLVGRSLPFWKHYFPELQKTFNGQFDDVTPEQFYRAINQVQPSLIRTDADEVTYNLHIIIRYEIEKMLFNENLSVDDLPRVWNEKYESYLGIRPPHDGVGVLQDVHWSGGMFGYFPSYSLGNMYSAQMMHKMREVMPNVDDLIGSGDLLPIKEWLTEHVYQYGKLLTPSEVIERMTGEALNPQYLVDYLTEKTKDVYQL